MDSYSALISRELSGRIAEERQRRIECILNIPSNSISTVSLTLMRHRGVIDGLDVAVQLLADIEREIMGGKREG